MIPKKKKKTKRRNQWRYREIVWAEFIKDRDGRKCRRCLRTEDQLRIVGRHLEAAHIVGKGMGIANRSVALDPENGLALCKTDAGQDGCHAWFDDPSSALKRVEFICEQIGRPAYEDLLARAQERWDRDLDKALELLKAARAQLKRAA